METMDRKLVSQRKVYPAQNMKEWLLILLTSMKYALCVMSEQASFVSVVTA